MGHKLANNPFSVHNNKVSERRNLFLWMIWLEFSCKLFEWNIRKEKYCIFSCDWDSVDILNLVSVQDWRRDNALSWQLAGRHQTCKRHISTSTLEYWTLLELWAMEHWDTIGALQNSGIITQGNAVIIYFQNWNQNIGRHLETWLEIEAVIQLGNCETMKECP